MENRVYLNDDMREKYDFVLVNLQTIASIEPNDKLYIKEDNLCHHPYSSTRSINRWWNNYNRSDCKKFINELYTVTLSDVIISITPLKFIDKPNMKKGKHRRRKKRNILKYSINKKLMELLIKTCKNSKEGLLHLMMTYSGDIEFSNFINNILSIIDKMD